jgi:hypothetical protein
MAPTNAASWDTPPGCSPRLVLQRVVMTGAELWASMLGPRAQRQRRRHLLALPHASGSSGGGGSGAGGAGGRRLLAEAPGSGDGGDDSGSDAAAAAAGSGVAGIAEPGADTFYVYADAVLRVAPGGAAWRVPDQGHAKVGVAVGAALGAAGGVALAAAAGVLGARAARARKQRRREGGGDDKLLPPLPGGTERGSGPPSGPPPASRAGSSPALSATSAGGGAWAVRAFREASTGGVRRSTEGTESSNPTSGAMLQPVVLATGAHAAGSKRSTSPDPRNGGGVAWGPAQHLQQLQQREAVARAFEMVVSGGGGSTPSQGRTTDSEARAHMARQQQFESAAQAVQALHHGSSWRQAQEDLVLDTVLGEGTFGMVGGGGRGWQGGGAARRPACGRRGRPVRARNGWRAHGGRMACAWHRFAPSRPPRCTARGGRAPSPPSSAWCSRPA